MQKTKKIEISMIVWINQKIFTLEICFLSVESLIQNITYVLNDTGPHVISGAIIVAENVKMSSKDYQRYVLFILNIENFRLNKQNDCFEFM